MRPGAETFAVSSVESAGKSRIRLMQTAFGTARPSFAKGYSPLYHVGETNRCPSCTRQHWIVGRMVAECAFCGMALPLEQFSTYGSSPRIERTGPVSNQLPEELRAIS
jgi:hypothetical protein